MKMKKKEVSGILLIFQFVPLDSWWYHYGDREHWKKPGLGLRGKIMSLVLDILILSYL